MPVPTLVVAAHGTSSAPGSATTAALVAAVSAARPDVPVRLCFLDVVRPSLAESLSAAPDGPCVVVPLLLSTGYHVQSDIPAVVAGRPHVRVARHLGPDPLVIEALAARLEPLSRPRVESVALVSVGSRRSEAAAELAVAGRLLADRLDRPVTALTVFDDVPGTLAALQEPVAVAPYLLAEGHFLDRVVAAAAGLARVAPPIGAHPALVSLVLARYDEVAAEAVR